MFAFYPLGYLFSILMCRLVMLTWGWRAVYLFSLIPALLILAFRFRLMNRIDSVPCSPSCSALTMQTWARSRR